MGCAHMPCSQRKLSRMGEDPRNSRKLFPSKVSRYRVPVPNICYAPDATHSFVCSACHIEMHGVMWVRGIQKSVNLICPLVPTGTYYHAPSNCYNYSYDYLKSNLFLGYSPDILPAQFNGGLARHVSKMVEQWTCKNFIPVSLLALIAKH